MSHSPLAEVKVPWQGEGDNSRRRSSEQPFTQIKIRSKQNRAREEKTINGARGRAGALMSSGVLHEKPSVAYAVKNYRHV